MFGPCSAAARVFEQSMLDSGVDLTASPSVQPLKKISCNARSLMVRPGGAGLAQGTGW